MKRRWLEGNITKRFFILLTSRRNFFTILSIYYLSLPNTHAQEIGFYTAAGSIASLLLQIPAGYLWDKWGNKNVIILSKLFFLISSTLFFFGSGFRFFFVAMIFQSLAGDAFSTGNLSAFLHDTLGWLKRESEYKKIASRLRGLASLISVWFIIGLPFLTTIDIKLPFAVAIFIDIIWLLFAFSLFPVKAKTILGETALQIKKIWPVMKQSWQTWFMAIAIFSALIMGFLMADSSFRSPYLQSLWYPVMFIGFVMWGSRLIWFIVGRYAYNIEKYISFSKLMLIEIIVFGAYYMTAASFHNPYIIWAIFALVIGYFRWRSDLYTNHLIQLIPNHAYKATLLSIEWQIVGIFKIIIVLVAGVLMQRSYSLWFFTLWIVLIIVLGICYLLIPKRTKDALDHRLQTNK